MQLFLLKTDSHASFQRDAALVAASLAGRKVKVSNVDNVAVLSKVSFHDAPFELPALLTDDGFVVGIGAALRTIARSSPATPVYGENVDEAAAVDQWVEFALGDLNSSLTLDWNVNDMLKGIDDALLTTAFMGTFRPTIADAIMLARLNHAGFMVNNVDPMVAGYPNLVRWLDTVTHYPEVHSSVPELCDAWIGARKIAPYQAPAVTPWANPFPATAGTAGTGASAAAPVPDVKPSFGPKSFPESKPKLRTSLGVCVVQWKGRDCPVGAAVAAKMTKTRMKFVVAGTESVAMETPKGVLGSDVEIVHYVLADQLALDERVWEWATFAKNELAADTKAFAEKCNKLNNHLMLRTFMVGSKLTAADVAVFAALNGGVLWKGTRSRYNLQHLERYMSMLESMPQFVEGKAAASAVEGSSSSNNLSKKEMEEMGNFDIKLEGAEMGKVVTRFPPEPSGYLHMGHIKASLLNRTFASQYKGTMLLRFDDTNPAKESQEFVDSILVDLLKLGIKPDKVVHTSDHFEKIQELAVRLIKEGKAYMDNTPQEQMAVERMDGIESKCRNQDVKTNLEMWQAMLDGTKEGQTYCMRAKIDMSDPNKTLRDPACFRYVGLPHQQTGDKYKAYPTYDFACPIVDSLDGVTHALRDRQFQDRNAQYAWFLEAMGLRNVVVWGFSRMNLKRCLLSKRKLQWFVDQKRVTGWDDPRVPSVRGVLRRGLTITALRKFILSQGASKNINLQSWDSLWSANKKEIDPVAGRYAALSYSDGAPLARCEILNYTNKDDAGAAIIEYRTKDLHPKNPSVGTKTVSYGPSVLLEHADASSIAVGEKFTLMGWGNAKVVDKSTAESGQVKLKVELMLEDKDFKSTKKVNWLADEIQNKVACELWELDHLITKDKLEEEDKLEDYITANSKIKRTALADMNVRTLKAGTIIQFERMGYYIVDSVPKTATSDEGHPVILISIPSK